MTDGIIAPSSPIGSPAPAPAAPPVENTTDSVPRETNNPIHSEPKEPAKVEVVQPKKPTALDALKKAEEKVNRDEAAKAKAAKPAEVKTTETPVQPKEAVAKAPEVPKAAEPAKAHDLAAEPWRAPPKRFNDVEKAEWDAAPDSAKQGIHRAVKELEQGIEKHRERAAKYDELKEFEELATKYNTTIKDGLKNYVAIDQALQGNDPQRKLAAIEEVFKAAKVTPQQIVAYYTGKPPEQAQAQQSRQVMELQQQVRQLSQQLQGVTTDITTQKEQQLETELNNWATDKPLAEKLAPQIAAFVQQGLSLDEAYANAEAEFKEMAAAAGFIPAAPAPATPPVVHNLNGSKSITGAPGAGSHLATSKPSKSTKDAVAKAMAALGVS